MSKQKMLHANPETGKVARVRAEQGGCPFVDSSDPNGGHYSTVEEMDAYLERRAELLSSDSSTGLSSVSEDREALTGSQSSSSPLGSYDPTEVKGGTDPEQMKAIEEKASEGKIAFVPKDLSKKEALQRYADYISENTEAGRASKDSADRLAEDPSNKDLQKENYENFKKLDAEISALGDNSARRVLWELPAYKAEKNREKETYHSMAENSQYTPGEKAYLEQLMFGGGYSYPETDSNGRFLGMQKVSFRLLPLKVNPNLTIAEHDIYSGWSLREDSWADNFNLRTKADSAGYTGYDVDGTPFFYSDSFGQKPIPESEEKEMNTLAKQKYRKAIEAKVVVDAVSKPGQPRANLESRFKEGFKVTKDYVTRHIAMNAAIRNNLKIAKISESDWKKMSLKEQESYDVVFSDYTERTDSDHSSVASTKVLKPYRGTGTYNLTEAAFIALHGDSHWGRGQRPSTELLEGNILVKGVGSDTSGD